MLIMCAIGVKHFSEIDRRDTWPDLEEGRSAVQLARAHLIMIF